MGINDEYLKELNVHSETSDKPKTDFDGSICVIPEKETLKAKEYLSRKDIQVLFLPDQLKSIGSWACAHMKNLKRISTPACKMQLGKEVFKGCEALEYIEVRDSVGSTSTQDWGYLCAAAVRLLRHEEFFSPDQTGQAEWFQRLDQAAESWLTLEDDNEFRPMWFGGEEDYDDNDTNIELFRENRRREKLQLCLLRLEHAAYLGGEQRQRMLDILKRQMPVDGGVGAEERNHLIWGWFSENYGQQVNAVRVVLEAGVVTAENEAWILQNSEKLCPEAHAVLLDWCAGRVDGQEYFDSLSL